MGFKLLYAFLVSIVISGTAYWRRSLSRSGVLGALLIGTFTLGFGGPLWGILLGLFFISSSLLSHFRKTDKRLAAEKFDKSDQRDFGQAMANGGLGALLALLNTLFPSPWWFPFYSGVIATVNADTWATELGTLSKRPPRLITTGRPVAVGTSGGVSRRGSVASLLGGLLIGLAAGLLQKRLFQKERVMPQFAVIGAIAGLAGSLFDSLLGATVQRIYYCSYCKKDTERKNHICGHSTRPLRGWSWLNNDLVNLLASIVGGFIALSLWKLWDPKKGDFREI